MIAIKLAVAGLLMMSGSADTRSLQDQQSGPAPQQNPQVDPQEQQQQQPQASPDDAADDRPAAADDPATREAEADSMRSDTPVPSGAMAWLVGRWCIQGQFHFMLSADGQLTLPEGIARDYSLHPYFGNRAVMDLIVHMPAPPGSDYGFHELGIFVVARGEPSFQDVRGTTSPIQRC